MNRFESQHYGPDSPLQRKLGEVLDGTISGIHRKVPYSETFLPLNATVYMSLPFPSTSSSLPNAPPEETLTNMTQMLLDDFAPDGDA